MKKITVEALRDHTFAGKEYTTGQKYSLDGDSFQSAEQYLETLRATGLAKHADDVLPATIEEAEQAAADTSSTAVKPMSVDDAPTPKPAKPAAKRTKNAGKNLKKK